MTREEAINELKNMANFNYTLAPLEVFEMAIKALEQEPCNNAISRQAVLDLIADYDLSMGQVVRGIHALPPVIPQPKTGHWVMPVQDDGMSDPIYYQVRCSKCGFDLDPQTWHMELHQYGADKYCPKCGRKMYEDKGVLEQLSEKQNNLSATNKAWSDAIEKNGYVN